MKYIRTKDGIYELANERTITEFQVIDHLNNRAFLKDEILAQADTIPELCDLVRFKTKDGVSHYIDLHKNTVADIVINFGGNNIIVDSVRYCIETDKGLIYVAKMDENGKLVLI